jgi:2-iminoacetate synthase
MSFFHLLNDLDPDQVLATLAQIDEARVRRALAADPCSSEDFLALLAPAARPFLEPMAERARESTIRQFGRVVQLFTPMYLSNFCTNGCLYCGFGSGNAIPRRQLTIEEVRREALDIAATGLRHILILTGDAPKIATEDYLEACCLELQRHFSSIAIEIYALTEAEYRRLIQAGVDGLVLYQESYHRPLYDTLHPFGPKRDFRFRLEAPERACQAGMRMVGIGALLGLDDWRRDAFCTGLHAQYLLDHWPEVEISVSLPRMRPHAGCYQPAHPVEDPDFVQILLAMRCFLPRCGITVSTRERAWFRDRILPLGVTKMSAGVTTAVGGHTQEEEGTGQFDISDGRSVAEMTETLIRLGYQPVYQDWQTLPSEHTDAPV